ISQAQIGAEVGTSYFGDPIFPAAQTPGGELTDEVGSGVIVGGPACADAIVWWQVEDESGRSGWVPETYNDAYLMNITSGAASTFVCPSAPLPRLQVGKDGVVVAGLGANNLRSAPAGDAAQTGSLPADAIFSVVSGPLCRGRHVWWQVEYQGVSGWTAEGEGDVYWLAPAG
ncbi:MAG: hypothetical protein IH587_03950, partial [Anaerolineae bacterium]|nr:hypothetical protein [Anaerolineae bacterium]